MSLTSSFSVETYYSAGSKFTSTSISTDLSIICYYWDVLDTVTNKSLCFYEGFDSNIFYYNWPYPGRFKVTLVVEDEDNVLSISSRRFTISVSRTVSQQVAPVTSGGVIAPKISPFDRIKIEANLINGKEEKELKTNIIYLDKSKKKSPFININVEYEIVEEEEIKCQLQL